MLTPRAEALLASIVPGDVIEFGPARFDHACVPHLNAGVVLSLAGDTSMVIYVSTDGSMGTVHPNWVNRRMEPWPQRRDH